MISIFRKYLLSLHRFHLMFSLSESNRVSRSIVLFTLTFYFFAVWIESYSGINFIKNRLTAILFGLPLVFLVFPINIWYLKNPPSNNELLTSKDNFSGILILVISIVLAVFFRK